VHDARVAAICLAHGVRELLTADRDFSLFPELRTRNPLPVARAERGGPTLVAENRCGNERSCSLSGAAWRNGTRGEQGGLGLLDRSYAST